MDQTLIHLLISHLPIFGTILGGLVLLHGIGVKSNQTNIAAYYIFVLSAIGAGIAYLTGEGAEESVENMQSVMESTIKTHEDFAIFALVSLIILGLTALIALYITYKNSLLSRSIAIIVLFISIISSMLVARTGYLGGLIRHTEINAIANPNTNIDKNEE